MEVTPAVDLEGRPSAGSTHRFRHMLSEHPALTLEACARLAGGWPATLIRCLGPNRPLLMGPADGLPFSQLSPAAAAAGIDTNGHAIRLYHLETDPGYRSLIEALLSRVRPLTGTDGVGARKGEGSLFFAAPGARTPVHCDRPHTLLFQAHGRKELTLGYFDDPDQLRFELEHTGSSCGWASRLPSRTETVSLGPGDGIYIPPLTFHSVQILGEVSVALSCTFATRHRDILRSRAYRAGRRLSPRTP